MSGILNFKLPWGGKQQSPSTELGSISIQTSVSTLPIALLWGRARLAPNLIWYGDFYATQQGGGKGSGGGKGGGNAGKSGGATSYSYRTSVVFGLCEGEIADIKQMWTGKSVSQFAGTVSSWKGYYAMVLFTGSYSQNPWTYLTTNHPEQALNYKGLAYVAQQNLPLDQSAQLPNFKFEIDGPHQVGYAATFNGTIVNGSNVLTVNSVASGNMGYGQLIESTHIVAGTSIVPGGTGNGGPGTYYLSAAQTANATETMTGTVVDCDPKDVLTDYMSNANYGVPSFSASYLGDLTQFSNYCKAQGLLISPAISQQEDASSFLARIMEISNSDIYWSDGLMKITPRGDTAVTGNGITYTPNLTPVFDLTDDDYLVTGAEEPVKLIVSDPTDAFNSVTVQWTNRANQYNPQPLELMDLNSANQIGLRKESAQTHAEICDAYCAQVSAQLRLQRMLNFRNQYKFTLPITFCMLEPTDLVTLTDANLGLSAQLVRILSVDEDENGNLAMVAEEMNVGAANPSLFGHQAHGGYIPNYNEAAPSTNTPIVFAPPVQIALGTLELWLSVSGPSGWGGCDVWVSSDDNTYRQLGRIIGGSRTGQLTANLATGVDPDTVHTLSVDLTESHGDLTSGTQADADAGYTLCYCDGELISYQTANLTAAYNYDLTYLRRGMYGSEIGAHLTGTKFVRLDGSQFDVPFTKDQIGQVIYLKLPAFNIWQGGLEDIASVSAIPITISGPPVPDNVSGFSAQQNGNVVVFQWNDVNEYALKGYDIGFAPQGTTDWSSFEILTEAARGTEMTNAAVPPGTWTFGIRARDIADQLSPTIATYDLIVVNNEDIVASVEQAPDWLGTLDNLFFHWTGVLVPKGQNLASDYVALSPPSAPSLSQVSGGNMGSTTYYAKVTYTTAAGETLPSSEANLAVSASYELQVASPAILAGAAGWNVYVSTSTGNETKQNTSPIAIGTAWTEPATGLIAGSALPSQNTTGWDVFDTFVPDPVATASYTSPTVDTGYNDTLRVYDTQVVHLGPGETGTPSSSFLVDTWLTGESDPNTYLPWTIGLVNCRYINGRIQLNITPGSVPYISEFAVIADTTPTIENQDSLAVSANGTVWTYPAPFHNAPFVQATVVSSNAAYATCSNVTANSATIHVWSANGVDTGGIANVSAVGE